MADFSGVWILDTAGTESMAPIARALGMPAFLGTMGLTKRVHQHREAGTNTIVVVETTSAMLTSITNKYFCDGRETHRRIPMTNHDTTQRTTVLDTPAGPASDMRSSMQNINVDPRNGSYVVLWRFGKDMDHLELVQTMTSNTNPPASVGPIVQRFLRQKQG